MISLQLTDIKDFMNKLLKSDAFDHFLLQEAVIGSAAVYTIDGRITKEAYTETEREELGLTGYPALPFSMLRGNCFDLIKGKRTPYYFKFVFLLSPENLNRMLAAAHSSYTQKDISGIYLNLKYQNQTLTLTTGISYQIFSMDKDLENEWDRMVPKFLAKHEISFNALLF